MTVSTSLFQNYDPELLPRIQHNIQFRLTNASMRQELYAHHLPSPERVTAYYAIFAGISRDLSSGNILNVCVNAIYADTTKRQPATCFKIIDSLLIKTRVGEGSPI